VIVVSENVNSMFNHGECSNPPWSAVASRRYRGSCHTCHTSPLCANGIPKIEFARSAIGLENKGRLGHCLSGSLSPGRNHVLQLVRFVIRRTVSKSMAVDMFDAIYNILCILLRHGPITDQSSIVVLQILESQALDVYRRPYLPIGQAEKTFLLLRALIASCPPDLLPRVPSNPKSVRHPSASNLPPLSNGTSTHGSTVACQLSKVLGTCMDELAAYAGKASAVLWEGAGMLAGVPGFQLKSHGMGPLGRGTFVLGGGHRALTGDAAATINRAVSDWVIVGFTRARLGKPGDAVAVH
jgi:hypothetical protein